MQINLTNGLNLISIGMNGLGFYFRFRKPVSLVWADCSGSVGMYMCLLPYSEAERRELRETITGSLNEDYTGREAELYEILKPLFLLFSNGPYELVFDNGTIKPEETVFSGGKGRTYTPEWYVQYAELVDPAKTEQLVIEHMRWMKQHGWEDKPIRMHSTTNYYLYEEEVYIATRPCAELNEERINFFEEEIKNGKRPFAILMNASFAQGETEYFVLDGHYKLEAYKKLGMQPPFALIKKVIADRSEMEFDIEGLAELLYPWQINHILENWPEGDEQLSKMVLKPGSKLNQYFKNGNIREYYANGQLKLEGFYINNRPQGTLKEWYHNDKLKSEHHFQDNHRSGTWKEWYASGKIHVVSNFNELGQNHGLEETFFEDGRKRSMQVYKNGKEADGYGFRRWTHTGHMEFEIWYKNGSLQRRKSYDDQGGLIYEEEYSEAEMKMIKLDVSPGTIRPAKKPAGRDTVGMVLWIIWFVLLVLMLLIFLLI